MARHKPPSRLRYEASHPQISFRIGGETKERLDGIREKTGQSYSSILQDVFENWSKWVEYSEQKYREGYEEAKRCFEITFQCDVCQGLCVVERGSNTHTEIMKHFKGMRWGHAECHKRVRRGYSSPA